jgi:hypothetical protein
VWHLRECPNRECIRGDQIRDGTRDDEIVCQVLELSFVGEQLHPAIIERTDRRDQFTHRLLCRIYQ